MALAGKNEGHEFSLVAGALAGGALHVGTNAVTKGMLKPNSWRQRIGSAIFQTGVRHKAAGRQIHPFIQRASDALLGPEISHIYKAGLDSSRTARKTLAALPEGGSAASGVAGLVTGRRSKFTERLLRKLPTSPLSRGDKAGDWAGAAVGGLAAGAIDPILPAVNIGRTLAAKSSLGTRMLKKEALKGVDQGAQKGVARTVKDYLLSPSLGIARDLGAEGHPYSGALRKAAAPAPQAVAKTYDSAGEVQRRLAQIRRNRSMATPAAA